MRTLLLEERFARPGLPPGWYTDTPRPSYTEKGWDCRGWDGVIIPLSHDAWSSVRVKVDLDSLAPGATAFCGADSLFSLSLVLAGPPGSCHQAADGSRILARSPVLLLTPDGTARLVFEWSPDHMSASANGTAALHATNLRRSACAGTLQMGFSRCRVRRIAVLGEALPGPHPPPAPLHPGYPLEVSVDFNDDLMACAWSQRTFESLFAELKAWGATRISWIDLGRETDGYFDAAPLGFRKHADPLRQVMRARF